MAHNVTKSTISLHGKQPGLMWTAVAVHFAAPSGQSRHCCQLVLFSTVTPACGRVRQAGPVCFNCFHGYFLAWACTLHKCETRIAGSTTRSLFSDKTSKDWVAVDLVEIRNLRHYDTSTGSPFQAFDLFQPLSPACWAPFIHLLWPSCHAAGYPGFCARDRPVARFYFWCPGHLSEAQFLPLKCESVCCTIAMHPRHNHCPHLQKKRWENCCRTSLTCGALVLLKTAFPWCWPGANKGRETEQRILQHPKPANLEKSNQFSWESQGHRTLGDQNACSSRAIVAA